MGKRSGKRDAGGSMSNALPPPDNQDALLRMNFLLQAATLCATTAADGRASTAIDSAIPADQSQKHQQQQQRPESEILGERTSTAKTMMTLGRFYGGVMRRLSAKTVLRIDPQVKHKFCRRCNTPLLPGRTSSVRIQGNRNKCIITHCLECGYKRKHPRGKQNYVPFTDRPDVVQVLEMTPNASRPAPERGQQRQKPHPNQQKKDDKSQRNHQHHQHQHRTKLSSSSDSISGAGAGLATKEIATSGPANVSDIQRS